LAEGALESFTNAFKGDSTGGAIGGAVSGQGKEKPGVSVGLLACCANAWHILHCFIHIYFMGRISWDGMTCVQDASSQVVESIKISQGDKSSEADSLVDKFSKVCSSVDLCHDKPQPSRCAHACKATADVMQACMLTTRVHVFGEMWKQSA